MGRPSLGVKFTAIRLSPDVLARIDALAGVGKRSEFIREAVERELERRSKGAEASHSGQIGGQDRVA